MAKPKTQQLAKTTPVILQKLFIGSLLGTLSVTVFGALISVPDAFASSDFGALLPIVPVVVMPIIIGATLYLSRRDRSNSVKTWFEISVVMASIFLIFTMTSEIFWRSMTSVPSQYYIWIANNGPILFATIVLILLIPRLRASKQW